MTRTFSCEYNSTVCCLGNTWQQRNTEIRRKRRNAITTLYIFNKESPWEGCTAITQICGKLILYKIVYGTQLWTAAEDYLLYHSLLWHVWDISNT